MKSEREEIDFSDIRLIKSLPELTNMHVLSLILRNVGMTSLKELPNMAFLQKLDCSKNSIKNLDISDSFIHLNFLNISDN